MKNRNTSRLGPLAGLALALLACGDDDRVPSNDADVAVDSADTAGGDGDATGDTSDTEADTVDAVANPWGAPLDPTSPWPKFRRDLAQTGRSDVVPTPDDTLAPWVFRTGKGIFSTPVIDGAGNVYLGSADRYFYALDAAGEELWRFETGEIIDSSALLDDAGRVIFGSGDGHVYALDRDDGAELWRFEADDPVPALGKPLRKLKFD